MQTEIEKNLKQAFEQVAQEEVPDRFANLLDQLRDAETTSSEETEND